MSTTPVCAAEHFGTSFLDFPDELLITVLRLLDPCDILAMRQVCLRAYLITQDKSLWNSTASRLSQLLPLSSPARISASTLTEVEESILLAVQVKKQWLRTRTSPPRRINTLDTLLRGGYWIDYLKVFEDRFAIIIYAAAGTVLLCDLDGLHFYGNSGQHAWGRVVGKWTSEGTIALKTCNSRFQESTVEVFVSFFMESENQSKLTVLSVSLSGNPAQERPFQQVTIVVENSLAYSKLNPTCLSPEASCVLYCRPQSIVATNWKTGFSKLLTAVDRTSTDDENMWNPVIALEAFESYVIVVQQDHLEIYVMPTNLDDRVAPANKPTRVDIVDLPDTTFHSASVALRETSAELLTVTVSLSDVFGMVSFYIVRLPRDPYALSTFLSFHQTPLYMDQSLAARGVFVGTDISLGPRGMRAAWIEKARRVMDRDIVVLMVGEENIDDINAVKQASMSIVYTTSSGNFQDDPTHITCDEVTGRIVLATRGGQLWVLDCWRRSLVKRKPLARFQVT